MDSRNKRVIAERKRGRPLGKNRVPISAEEQKSRNAMYEKERRQEQSEGIERLAREVGLDSKSKQAEVLATAVNYIFRRMVEPKMDLRAMCSLYQQLETQIAEAESRLAALEGSLYSQNSYTRKRAASPSERYSKRVKYEYIEPTDFCISVPECLTPPSDHQFDEAYSLAALDEIDSKDLIFATSDLDVVGPIYDWSIDTAKYV